LEFFLPPEPSRAGAEVPVQCLRADVLLVGHLVQPPDNPAHGPLAGIMAAANDFGEPAGLLLRDGLEKPLPCTAGRRVDHVELRFPSRFIWKRRSSFPEARRERDQQ
jgi:hypothetical protein